MRMHQLIYFAGAETFYHVIYEHDEWRNWLRARAGHRGDRNILDRDIQIEEFIIMKHYQMTGIIDIITEKQYVSYEPLIEAMEERHIPVMEIDFEEFE